MAEAHAHFDDELLSAYLDDELTAEERARVEERLSADPASRQLLDELRSVSQAMKGLPTASLNADLRDSVLRRAERAMLVAKDAGSTSRPNEVAHRLPFGRTKRAWIWAGAAVAAGLMLMFIEREANQNAGLPQKVAMKEPALAAPKEPIGPLTVRALEKPAEESSVAEALDAARPVPPLADAPRSAVARGAAVSSESVSPEAVATNEAAESRRLGVRADDVTHYGDAGGVGGGGREGPAPAAAAAAEDKLLVVHVSVTPEAMRNRAFDTTLLNNQIQVEQDVRESDKSKLSDELEVVVVEAAPSQVYSTLADIKADTKNYVGIAVEQQSAPLDAVLAKKTQAADVQQFNRGRVANQQQVQLDRQLRNYHITTDQYMYFRSRQLSAQETEQKDQLSDMASRAAVQDQAAVPPAAESQTSAPQTLALGRDQAQADLSASSSPAQTSGKLQFSKSESLDRASQNVTRRAVQKLADSADRLQVLFVLQADEIAVTPSAGAPISAEPGLKSDE